MTNLEVLVSVSQTLLRVRGEWNNQASSQDDIHNVVADVWTMMQVGDDTIIADAVKELESRRRR